METRKGSGPPPHYHIRWSALEKLDWEAFVFAFLFSLWLCSAPQALAATSAAVAQGNLTPSTSNTYWYCQLSTAEAGKIYVSDVSGPFAVTGNDQAFYKDLITAFGDFLRTKYGVSVNMNPYCSHYAVESDARSAVQQTLQGNNRIATGWKYTGHALATPSATNVPVGPDGVVLTSAASGTLTPYSCYLQYVFPNTKRQTTYTTGAFSTTQSHDWTLFWWSKYIHSTYHISGKAYVNLSCDKLLGNPAQQQATLDKNITSWKQHESDVVQLNWSPTETAPPSEVVPPWPEITNSDFDAAGSQPAAAQTAPTAYIICYANATDARKEYISAIFPGGKYVSIAPDAFPAGQFPFENYVYTHLDKQLGAAGFNVYRSEAAAQAALQAWKQQEKAGSGLQIIETGWVYKGPEPGPYHP